MKPSEANEYGVIAFEKPFVADFIKLKGIFGDIDNFVFDFVGKEYDQESAQVEDNFGQLNSIYFEGKFRFLYTYVCILI